VNMTSMTNNNNNNNNRTPSPLIDYSQPGLINNVVAGRRFLEKCLLFIPEGHPVMITTLVATLHQIAAIDKIPKEAVQAIRSATYLLDEMDEGAIASMARDAVNDQLTYINNELKSMTVHFRAMLESKTEKYMAAITASTKNIAASPHRSYRDALTGGNTILSNSDPRIIAREGIKARQVLFDFPADSEIRELSQNDVLSKFNEAIVLAGGNAMDHKLRSIERLVNKGLLREFLTDEGAKWFSQQENIYGFIIALGSLGKDLTVKK